MRPSSSTRRERSDKRTFVGVLTQGTAGRSCPNANPPFDNFSLCRDCASLSRARPAGGSIKAEAFGRCGKTAFEDNPGTCAGGFADPHDTTGALLGGGRSTSDNRAAELCCQDILEPAPPSTRRGGAAFAKRGGSGALPALRTAEPPCASSSVEVWSAAMMCSLRAPIDRIRLHPSTRLMSSQPPLALSLKWKKRS